MHGGAHPLPQGGPPRTWSHHKPETNQTGQQNRQSLTKSNQISVSPSEPRERYKKDLPLADLSADDDPAVLPGGVEGDLGRGEQLLGLPLHGRPPTGALAVPFLLLCPCPYGGMGEGERYRAGEGKSWNKPR